MVGLLPNKFLGLTGTDKRGAWAVVVLGCPGFCHLLSPVAGVSLSPTGEILPSCCL